MADKHLPFAFVLLLFIPLVSQSENEELKRCSGHGARGALPENSIRVITLNISHGRHTALNQWLVGQRETYENLDRIAVLLADSKPDVVALQEADGPSRWSGNFDHVAYLAERAGFNCRVHGLHSRTWMSNYGTALLSDSQPRSYASVSFAPSWPSKRKGFTRATFDWMVGGRNQPVAVVSVHLDFLRARVRDRQVDELLQELETVDGPLVVMGDFNTGWGDPASPVRRLADELDLKTYAPDNVDMGTYRKTTGRRLDWILVSEQLDFIEFGVIPEVVADHFAVYAELGYR